MNDDAACLRHILEAIGRLENYSLRTNREDFESDTLFQDAVIRQIEIVGEAAKRVSPELKKKHAEIPWSDITGMRNKLIHGYMLVDIKAVWATLERDIPVLKEQVKAIIENR